jgi:hypothetical protein
MQLPKTTLFLIFTFLLVFGVTIISQRALGINIGSNLDLGSIRRITNLPVPVAGGEAANKDYVDSAASPPIPTGLYGACNYVESAGCNPCGGTAPTTCVNGGPGPCDWRCECVAGYTRVQVGIDNLNAAGPRNWHSCQKN